MAFIEKTANRFWGFAYLRPRTEKKVAEKLAGLNFPVYLPLINKARLHHGTKIVTPFPMFLLPFFLEEVLFGQIPSRAFSIPFVRGHWLQERCSRKSLETTLLFLFHDEDVLC